jgi:hypothetical protein
MEEQKENKHDIRFRLVIIRNRMQTKVFYYQKFKILDFLASEGASLTSE